MESYNDAMEDNSPEDFHYSAPVEEQVLRSLPTPVLAKRTGASSSFTLSSGKDTKDTMQLYQVRNSSNGLDWVLRIRDIEYKLHGNKFLSMEEAEHIHIEMTKEFRAGIKKNVWKDQEIRLLQWVVLNYVYQNNKNVARFKSADWEYVTVILPGYSRRSCKTQWLKTQNIKVNKSSWTEEEDEQLISIVKRLGIKQWSEVATEFNKHFNAHERTRKQCRDRWLNYLDPNVNKGEMSPSEELHLFCYWRDLGNRWVEIAKLMGRSENWVKNNWKKILKREGVTTEDQDSQQVSALIARLTEIAAKQIKQPESLLTMEDVNNDVASEGILTVREETKDVRRKEWPCIGPEETMKWSDKEKVLVSVKSYDYDFNDSVEEGDLMRMNSLNVQDYNSIGIGSSSNINFEYNQS